jgi:hypothetical protein
VGYKIFSLYSYVELSQHRPNKGMTKKDINADPIFLVINKFEGTSSFLHQIYGHQKSKKRAIFVIENENIQESDGESLDLHLQITMHFKRDKLDKMGVGSISCLIRFFAALDLY